MKSIIAILKVIGVVSATLIIYSIYIIGYGCLRIIRKPTQNWLNTILKFWGKICANILSIKIRIAGKKPEPPFFLVSNHLSYVDIIVLLGTLDTTLVAKSEVADWPVLGTIAQSIGVVFIDRRNKMDIRRVNSEISSKVSDHRGLTLFPEGTTSSGDKILRFRPSLLQYPAQSKLGVHYCALHYELPASKNSAHNIVCWWRDESMFQHLLNLAKEVPINATISFGSDAIYEEDRKILALKLHEKVESLFTPMCNAGEATSEAVKF